MILVKNCNIIYIYDFKKGERIMVKIKFQYRDSYSYPNWNTQECIVNSIEECKEIYGLGRDCEYEILKVEDVK